MVHYVAADDALRSQRPVHVHTVPEVGQLGVAADHQHFSNAVECITNLAEELVLGAHVAAVLARELQVLVYLALHHRFGAELQQLCRLMIDERDGVKAADGRIEASGKCPVCAAPDRHNGQQWLNVTACRWLEQKDLPVPKLSSQHRNALPARQFAFPAQRKEPLENASHVRNAIARFDQVQDVSDEQRDEAWRRIEAAARLYGVVLHETDWRELLLRRGADRPLREP